MKIFVAIPVYDGKLPIRTVKCLLEEQSVAYGVGDELSFDFLSSMGGIAVARNQIAEEFLASGFEKLVFLDSDITFEPGAIVDLAHKPVDFVGGCYRYKKDGEEYPVSFLPQKELWSDKNGLIEVLGVPTGFLALSRKVFESFDEKFPDRKFKNFGNTGSAYFQMPCADDGTLYGEDYYFCKEWRAMGGKVYMDPEIKLTHWSFNPIPYEGHIGYWLKNREKTPLETHIDFSKFEPIKIDEIKIEGLS